MSVSVVAFLCAISIARPDCGRANAIDVLTFPAAPNELACMRDAQVTLAELAIRADAEHYWKVTCSRKTTDRTVG